MENTKWRLFLYTRQDLEQSIEEVVALVVDEEEGGEVDNVNLPDGFHAQFRIFQALDLLDVFLGQHGSRTAYGTQIETAILLASVSHLLRTITLGEGDHGTASIHERIEVGIHTTGSGGTEGT